MELHHNLDAHRKPASPCIPGFSPDPSICVVDGVYYLITSSFHLFPGIPVYSSPDLRTWRLVGHAISRREQLSLRHSDTELGSGTSPTIATGGIWAPTIRHHAGVTYIVATNVVFHKGRTLSSRQNFIICTTDIANSKWSNPKYFEFDGIDPSLFFDDDGKTYVQVCAHPRGGIWQFQVDIETAQPITPPVLIWAGWDGRFTEGPHIYKKDGYYFLLVAEGGTFEHHMVSIARSASIDGPFEPCPANPLLTGPINDQIHHIGHGDLFQDKNQDWWTVLLAVRRVGAHFPLGRETFLTRVDWPQGSWPTIKRMLPAEPSSLVKDLGFVHLRDAILSNYTFKNGELGIRPTSIGLDSHKDSPSFAARRQLQLFGTSSAALHTAVSGSASDLRAGICVYKDEHRFAALGYDFQACNIYFEARNRATGFSAAATLPVGEGNRLMHLRVVYTQTEWEFQYRADDAREWIKAGLLDTAQLSGRDFIGPVIGMFATCSKSCDVTRVYFEKIDI